MGLFWGLIVVVVVGIGVAILSDDLWSRLAWWAVGLKKMDGVPHCPKKAHDWGPIALGENWTCVNYKPQICMKCCKTRSVKV